MKYLAFAFCGIVTLSLVPGLAQESPSKAPAAARKKAPDFEAVFLTPIVASGDMGAFNEKVNELLKKRSAEGWELVTATSSPKVDGGTSQVFFCQYIFKRE